VHASKGCRLSMSLLNYAGFESSAPIVLDC
jgi:hypothetical protein